MKTLKEFVQDYETILYDEYLVKEEYDQLLENTYNIHINESDAQYKGQFDLSEFLTFTILRKHSTNTKIEYNGNELENKFDNIFFDKIKIVYNDSNKQSGGYVKNDNEIQITINSKENKRYENIFSCVSHELKHAWQDYKNCHKQLKEIISSDVYRNSIKYLKDNNLDNSIVANIVYRTIKHEYDAFASEFASDFKIEVYKHNPKSLKDCLELARKSSVYDEIYKIYLVCEYINDNGKFIGITKDNLLTSFKNIYKHEISWMTFYNKYVNQLRKLFSKICNIIANVFYNYIDEMENKENVNESYVIRPSRKFGVQLHRHIEINK